MFTSVRLCWVLGIVAVVGIGWEEWKRSSVTQIAQLQVVEIRLLEQELAEDRSKGTYENGYQDALIRTGRGSGAYADGYDAAMQITSNANYADGYHNAIKQFGYQTVSQEAKISLAKYVEQQKSDIQNASLKTK